MGTKILGEYPMLDVVDIVKRWCAKNYYGDAAVTLKIDGCVTTEFLSFYADSMDFEWDSDWWEGSKNIELLGFRILRDLRFYGYPDSCNEDDDGENTDAPQ